MRVRRKRKPVSPCSDSALNEKHLGSSFDDFLAEERLLEATEAVAAKRVLAFELSKAMEEKQLSKTDMARRMKTSCSALDRESYAKG